MSKSSEIKVDFVICGAQKAGTSALDSYLRNHPQVCMANKKEVHFFDQESNFTELNPDYSLYHRFFSLDKSHKVLGEATPIYMYWFDSPRRIWEYNPNMKLIVVLRNPVDRAYSHWNMEKSRGKESLPFLEALQKEELRRKESLPYQHRVYSYIDRGFYLEQLRRLWHYFSRDNILILKNECLRDAPDKCLEKVCTFLGISNFERIIPKEVHSLSYQEKIGEREKSYLLSIYEYEIKGLERMLGWDCSDWLFG